jgi:polyisoprenoid-binding protein YceI
MQSSRKRLLGGVGALAVVVIAAVIVYFAFIKSDAPPPLTLNSVATTSTVAGAASGSTAASAATTTAAAGASSASTTNLDGTWKITTASQVGYRVTEDLVGGLANNVAVGRTNAVTGTVAISGTSATAVDATADLTKLASDSSRRDGQVQSRILNTAQFPKATFKLTAPISFGSVPAVGAEKKASATGDLTIHGVTKKVTFDVTYTLVSATEIRMLGTVAMVWADYGIPSPTFAGVADVRDNGSMEFLIVATR